MASLLVKVLYKRAKLKKGIIIVMMKLNDLEVCLTPIRLMSSTSEG